MQLWVVVATKLLMTSGWEKKQDNNILTTKGWTTILFSKSPTFALFVTQELGNVYTKVS